MRCNPPMPQNRATHSNHCRKIGLYLRSSQGQQSSPAVQLCVRSPIHCSNIRYFARHREKHLQYVYLSKKNTCILHAQGIVQKFNPESNQVKVSRKHNQCPWNWVATVGEQLRHLATILYFYTQCINAGYAFPHLGWFGGLHVGYQPQLTFSEWWTKNIYLLGNPSWLVPKGFNQMPTPSISQVTHWWVFHHSPSVYESDDQRSKTPGLICKGKSSEPLNQC